MLALAVWNFIQHLRNRSPGTPRWDAAAPLDRQPTAAACAVPPAVKPPATHPRAQSEMELELNSRTVSGATGRRMIRELKASLRDRPPDGAVPHQHPLPPLELPPSQHTVGDRTSSELPSPGHERWSSRQARTAAAHAGEHRVSLSRPKKSPPGTCSGQRERRHSKGLATRPLPPTLMVDAAPDHVPTALLSSSASERGHRRAGTELMHLFAELESLAPGSPQGCAPCEADSGAEAGAEAEPEAPDAAGFGVRPLAGHARTFTGNSQDSWQASAPESVAGSAAGGGRGLRHTEVSATPSGAEGIASVPAAAPKKPAALRRPPKRHSSTARRHLVGRSRPSAGSGTSACNSPRGSASAKETSMYAKYIEWREGYQRWRSGGAAGAHGEITKKTTT